MIESFGLRVSQAMNQVVVRTTMGGAQPVAAALDREGWTEVVGTIAGDDTVLVICPDMKRAQRSGSAAEDDAGVMTKTVQTAVVGVTGYAGAELARLLLHHPRLKGQPPVFAGRVDDKDAARGGIPLAEIHPQLADNNGSRRPEAGATFVGAARRSRRRSAVSRHAARAVPRVGARGA